MTPGARPSVHFLFSYKAMSSQTDNIHADSMSSSAAVGHGRPPRLRVGARVGPHTVRACLGEGPLGEVYTVLFGTTGHVACLTVPPPGLPDPGYAAWLRRVAPVATHPCLARQFDSGVSQEGVPWLRSEFIEGAPEWVLRSPLDPALVPLADPADAAERDPTSTQEKYILVPTLEDLIAAAGPQLSQRDKCVIAYDVLDAVASLHAAGLRADSLDPGDILLDRVPHGSRPIAKLRFYAVDPASSPDGFATDVAAAGELLETLFGGASARGASSRSLSRLDRETLELAAAAKRGGMSAQALFDGFAGIMARNGVSPESRTDPDEATAKAPVPEVADEGSGRRRRHRHHHHHSARDAEDAQSRRAPGFLSALASGSEAAQQALDFLRAISVIAVVLVFAIGVFIWLRWSDEESRRRSPVGTTVAFSAVSVIPLSEEEKSWDGGGIPDVYALDANQLQSLATTGNHLAIARKAIMSLPPDPWRNPSAIRMARDEIMPILAQLEQSAPTRADAACLWGHVRLLGLGCQADVPDAIRTLEEAVASGCQEARMILGDLYTSNYPMPASYPSKRLGRDRRAIALYRAAAGEISSPTPYWNAAADRICWLLRRTKSTSAYADDWEGWLKQAAAARHIPSMALRAIPGPFSASNPVEALNLLRQIGVHPQAGEEVRAWAWTRMATMFAKGSGTPKSESSAMTWFGRAADKGNRSAMLALAALLEKGIGTESGAPDLARAAEWRRRASDAAPEPTFEPTWLPVSLEPPPHR